MIPILGGAGFPQRPWISTPRHSRNGSESIFRKSARSSPKLGTFLRLISGSWGRKEARSQKPEAGSQKYHLVRIWLLWLLRSSRPNYGFSALGNRSYLPWLFNTDHRGVSFLRRPLPFCKKHPVARCQI